MNARKAMRLSVGLGTVSLALALTISAHAQRAGGQSETPPPAQTAPKTDVHVGEQELSKFAAAVLKLEQIKQSYSQELGQASGKEEAQKIQAKMQQEMRQAINDEGLSVQHYSKISQAVQNDQQLREQLNQMIQNRPD